MWGLQHPYAQTRYAQNKFMDTPLYMEPVRL